MNAIVGEWTPERLSAQLSLSRGGDGGDDDLNPGMARPSRLRAAAVLIAFIFRADGPHILLTRRADHLKAHAGQIAFPGGRIDPEDSGPEDAALREAEEEVGLPRAAVTLLGRMDDYVTRTGYRVTPIVGWATPPHVYRPCPVETAEVFEAPAGLLLDPSRRTVESYDIGGGELRRFYAIDVDGRRVWGATAGMLARLSGVLEPSPC